MVYSLNTPPQKEINKTIVTMRSNFSLANSSVIESLTFPGVKYLQKLCIENVRFSPNCPALTPKFEEKGSGKPWTSHVNFDSLTNEWIYFFFSKEEKIKKINWSYQIYKCRRRNVSSITWMGSSDGWGRAKGWTNKANCMPDVVRRSLVHGIC